MRIAKEIKESGYFWLDTSQKTKYPGIDHDDNNLKRERVNLWITFFPT